MSRATPERSRNVAALQKSTAEIRRLTKMTTRAVERRDATIRTAAASGLSRKEIASLTKLTIQRVGQIINDEQERNTQ